MSLTIPVPPDFKGWVWLLMGVFFARAFSKRLDQEAQATGWFKGQPRWRRGAIGRMLDFTHHWWGAALLILYAPMFTENPELLYAVTWFATGVFIDDLPDIPPRLREVLAGYGDWWMGKGSRG